MQKPKINKELKRSQFLIATLFSLFLFLILEIVGVIFYFGVPKIEKYFFEKELNNLSQNYQNKIDKKKINKNKDIERLKIGDYVVLLDKNDKNNFLVQKGGKNLQENLKQIIIKNKFSAINIDTENFSNEYFFSKSNLKENFLLDGEKFFTLNKKFFEKYEIPKNFSGIKYFSLNGRKIFIFNKEIFIPSIGKNFLYQAVIPSNIPEKALNTFIFYFQIIIFLISFLSFFIFYFFSKKILEPIRISNEKIKKFSDNVGHEIMSPITVISGIAQLGQMGKEVDVEKILEATKKITNLMQTLKKISLLERKNFDLIEKDLGIEIKNFLISKKNDKLSSEIILKLTKGVSKKIDEGIFCLILENLFSNAEKYKIKNSLVKIFLEKNKIIFENEVEKEVGKSDLKKLKEKFFQADNSRRSKGTGLGLSIIDECLKILGWRIKFYSEDKIFRTEILF